MSDGYYMLNHVLCGNPAIDTAGIVQGAKHNNKVAAVGFLDGNLLFLCLTGNDNLHKMKM